MDREVTDGERESRAESVVSGLGLSAEPASGPSCRPAAVETLESARAALTAVRDVLPQLSGAELAEVLGLADAVRSEAAATQVLVTTEAAHRGEFVSARRGAGSAHEWVIEHAPSLRQAGAGQLASFAVEVAHCTPAGQWSTTGPRAGVFADPERAEGVVWARVLTGEVGLPLARSVLTEMARLADRLRPEAIPTVATAMLDHGVLCGVGKVRQVRTRLLAEYGLDGELEDQQRRLRSAAHLSQPQVAEGDITEYRMGLTPEQSAALEAALGPLAKPVPDPTTGVFDPRSTGQRRAEALLSIVTGHAARDGEESAPAGAPTALHVTMGLTDLVRLLALSGSTWPGSALPGSTPSAGSVQGCASTSAFGTVLGSTASGTILNAGDIRRLACDADIIPVVLGSAGEVLDVGRAARLFTRGQRRALTHRDGGCTWPGCDAPASWARAHHVVHWADGGRSDLSNAALLCQRHHTHVHDQRLVATVHPPDEDGRSVTWECTPGSYDLALPGRLATLRREAERRRDDRRRDTERRRRALDVGSRDPWDDIWVFDDDAIDELEAIHDADVWGPGSLHELPEPAAA
ncbi:DUF222 domain-containing protein [Knoellia sp. LjRoot47]|uniref:HNH endonuclease signature motif containing protein n=1 Tax=Knoellia sp. LjRoot47 TaxID=3342330 RepID=UPI003ECFA96F